MAKLTKKQKTFVEEYVIDLNATQAAIRAGYSVDSAREIGCENLTKPNIHEAIGKRMAERSKRTGVNADRVVLELARIAFANSKDFINFDDATILEGATEDDMAAVAGIKIKTINKDDSTISEREIKMCNKIQALDLLGKHLGMYKTNVNITQEEDQQKKVSAIADILMQMQSVDDNEIAGDGNG